jgi:1-acyl-sn-glycerol-3-phosphate acyltransferase
MPLWLRGLLVYGVCFSWCAALLLVGGPIALAFPTLAWRNRVSLVAGRLWVTVCMAVAGVRLRVVAGREHLAARPAIFLFNHTNLLDFFVNGRLATPGWLVFGKREVLKLPFLGLAWALGGHPLIRREDRAQWEAELLRVEGLLRRGWCTIVAPEGTRSKDGRLGQFKKGAFHMALHTGAPLVPIVIRGAAPLVKGVVPVPGTIEVEVLPPVATTGWTEATLDGHMAEVRGLYLRALGQEAG